MCLMDIKRGRYLDHSNDAPPFVKGPSARRDIARPFRRLKGAPAFEASGQLLSIIRTFIPLCTGLG